MNTAPTPAPGVLTTTSLDIHRARLELATAAAALAAICRDAGAPPVDVSRATEAVTFAAGRLAAAALVASR
jgi:hypothetical protein